MQTMEEETIKYVPRLDTTYAAVKWHDKKDQVWIDGNLLEKEANGFINEHAIWIKMFGWGMIFGAFLITGLVMRHNKRKMYKQVCKEQKANALNSRECNKC